MIDVDENLHKFYTPKLHGCSVQFSASANTSHIESSLI